MKRAFLAISFLALCCASFPARAEDDVIRIGVLTDLSGSMAAASGQGSVEAAQMAVEDAARFSTRPITLISGDYQSRADLAEHISEDWLKRQSVDMVVDVPNPIIASRLQELFKAQNRILLSSMPRRTDDDDMCGMNGAFWLYDRETIIANLVRALLAEHKTRWFFLGSDTPSGMSFAASAKTQVQQGGGQVVGEAYMGPRMGGLKAILNQVRAAQADLLFLAFDRPDIRHLLRHWPSDLVDATPPLAFTPIPLSDMYDIKDQPVPPFYILTSFYWNGDNESRAFSQRFASRNHGFMPTAIHASVYSAVLHYLQSVAATNNKSADVVMANMKAVPLQDSFFQGSRVREDGVVMNRAHLLLLKDLKDRDTPDDFFRVVRTLSLPEILPPREYPCPKPIPGAGALSGGAKGK